MIIAPILNATEAEIARVMNAIAIIVVYFLFVIIIVVVTCLRFFVFLTAKIGRISQVCKLFPKKTIMI